MKHSLIKKYLGLEIKDVGYFDAVNASDLEASLQKSPMQMNLDGSMSIILDPIRDRKQKNVKIENSND